MNLKVFLLFFCIISGCTTLSQKDCEETNWLSKGIKDGSKGVNYNQLNKYEKQCGAYNINVERSAYMDGHQQGLLTYCTYKNGHRSALAGERLNKVCQGELKKNFSEGYQDGYVIYRRQEQLKEQMEQQAEDAENRLKENEEQTLRAMEQCHFDSDCGPNFRCSSEYKTIGSTSGFVNTCQIN